MSCFARWGNIDLSKNSKSNVYVVGPVCGGSGLDATVSCRLGGEVCFGELGSDV